MNNVENRSSFFLNNKASQKPTPLQKTAMKRNDPYRQQELDTSKRDAKVEINDAIKDFSRIKKVVDAAPEVDNADKIAKLREQINAGTYKVDYEALADRIFEQEF